jgi:hypothetical protein
MSNDTVPQPATDTLNALDVGARLDALTCELREARREIDVLRRSRHRRPSAWSVAVLLTVATGTFGLGLSAQGQPLQTGDFWAPFHIFGDDRVLVLRAQGHAGRPSVEIGPANGGGILLGVDNTGAGFLAVKGLGGKYTTVINEKGVQVMNDDGMTAAAHLGFDSARKPLLRLGGDKTGGLEAGTGASGTGFLTVRAATGQPGISLGAESSGGGRVVVRGEGGAVATLGTSQLGQVGLTMGVENKAPGATFGLLSDGSGQTVLSDESGEVVVGAFKFDPIGVRLFDKAGGERVTVHAKNGTGVVSVRNAQNAPVAGITTRADGGGAVVVANSSGATLAQMGTTTDGRGEIKVLGAGGALLAVMAQSPDSNGGAIEVYNGSVAVANIRPGSAGGGYIQLLDAGGRTAVEAGVSPAGVGVVRAGPNFKCGSNYLGLKVPDCIVGLP